MIMPSRMSKSSMDDLLKASAESRALSEQD
jgi:hypothetical protein